MALPEKQRKAFENILLNRQLTPPPPGVDPKNAQSDCGREVEDILENEYCIPDKLKNGWYPTFSGGVDIQAPWGDVEVKTRQLGCSSRVNIGAITTKELDQCILRDLPFEDTDFSRYACDHMWSFYNELFKIVKVEFHDMSYHSDLYKIAYEILKNTDNVQNEKYINVINSKMVWERTSETASQWKLRVTEKELNKLFQACNGQRFFEFEEV